MHTGSEGGRWVDPKVAAVAAEVAVRVVHRWCRTGVVVARRLPGRRGRWRVQLGPDGLPVNRG